MRFHPLLLLVLLLAAAPSQAGEFRVVGYLPDYRVDKLDWDSLAHLTDLVVFSAQPTAEGRLDRTSLAPVPWAKLRAATQSHHARLMLCVGGWGRSNHFAAVAASPERRARFVASALQVCAEQQLDGIDLDWEHPASPAEARDYTALLTELRTAFAKRRLTLSLTLAVGTPLSRQAFEAVDWIQVMAYDHAGRHATLEAAQRDVEQLLAAGAPPQKLTLGLPFYARGVINRSRVLNYVEIVAQHHPEPHVNEIDGLYFNGPALIDGKVRLVQHQKLAGVIVWEITQDAPGDASLLRRIGQLRREMPSR